MCKKKELIINLESANMYACTGARISWRKVISNSPMVVFQEEPKCYLLSLELLSTSGFDFAGIVCLQDQLEVSKGFFFIN